MIEIQERTEGALIIDGTREGNPLVLDYIKFELIRGGILANFVAATEPLKEVEAKHLFWQLICGLEYIHNRQVAHGSLKLQNIMLQEENGRWTLKIKNFRFA